MATCIRASLSRHFRAWPRRSLYSTDATQITPRKGDKVVVGMSGGVDSSVTAKLLADQDFDLSAVFMRNWDTRDESGTDKGCEWEKDWEDVQRVCKVLDVPCEMIDLSRQYWNRVFEPSLKQWESGVTPNPDVWCNKEIKFGALLEYLSLSKTSWFATGHYARKAWSPSGFGSQPSTTRPKLLRAADRLKDQCYYLSSISEQGLRRALFPLGDLTKVQVRELAKKHRLPTAERSESMGLCFVGEKSKFSNFISSYIPPSPGSIVDMTTGKRVGEHQGLWTYTIGENAKLGGMAERMFVAKKDIETNTVYIVPGTDHEALYVATVDVTGFSWIWADSPPEGLQHPVGFRAYVQHRHRMEGVLCTVVQSSTNPNDTTIHFDDPQKAVAPGQVAALWDYSGEWCLGCGTIASVGPEIQAVPENVSVPLRNKVAREVGRGGKMIEKALNLRWEKVRD